MGPNRRQICRHCNSHQAAALLVNPKQQQAAVDIPLCATAAGKPSTSPYVRGDYEGKLYAGHPAFEWVLAVISSITALKVRPHHRTPLQPPVTPYSCVTPTVAVHEQAPQPALQHGEHMGKA